MLMNYSWNFFLYGQFGLYNYIFLVIMTIKLYLRVFTDKSSHCDVSQILTSTARPEPASSSSPFLIKSSHADKHFLSTPKWGEVIIRAVNLKEKKTLLSLWLMINRLYICISARERLLSGNPAWLMNAG